MQLLMSAKVALRARSGHWLNYRNNTLCLNLAIIKPLKIKNKIFLALNIIRKDHSITDFFQGRSSKIYILFSFIGRLAPLYALHAVPEVAGKSAI
jgi:hypothetical protein